MEKRPKAGGPLLRPPRTSTGLNQSPSPAEARRRQHSLRLRSVGADGAAEPEHGLGVLVYLQSPWLKLGNAGRVSSEPLNV